MTVAPCKGVTVSIRTVKQSPIIYHNFISLFHLENYFVYSFILEFVATVGPLSRSMGLSTHKCSYCMTNSFTSKYN